MVVDPSFVLSATSMNNFLECPNKFLYESVLRVPSSYSTNIATVYGSAVHTALEKYFKTSPKNRSLQFILTTIKEYIDNNSSLTEEDNKNILERAEKSMKEYYKKLSKEKNPLSVERKVSATYQEIPLTGKIDKISYDKDENLKIVDYKTSTIG